MNVNYVNAIFTATKSIFNDFLGVDKVEQGELRAGKYTVENNSISVILGLSGDLKGQIICSMDYETSLRIVGKMMGGIEVKTLDDLSLSAIQELGNWIAGGSSTEISKEGIFVDVTTPIINEGKSKLHSNNVFLTLPFKSEIGTIELNVSLKEKEEY